MDHSMIPPQAEKEPGEQAVPPQPPPHEELVHYRGIGPPYMNGYVSLADQLSRIRRLNSIELTHSRSWRMNFRDYRDDFDDQYYSGYGPPPMHHEMHPYPPPHPQPGHGEPAPRPIPRGLPPPPPPPGPPQPRYMTRGPPPPPPPARHGPPPHWVDPPVAPPPAGYPPTNYFSDENPNGCTVM